MAPKSSSSRLRLGLLSTDPLRLVGLQAIFENTSVEVELISIPGAFRDGHLSMILIDIQAAGELFSLLNTFHRAHPNIRVIVMGDHADLDFIKKVIAAGARGYLTYNTPEADLHRAVDVVREGSVWAPRKVLANLLDEANPTLPPGPTEPGFTPRELQVLELLTAGRSNREIGLSLSIDESTVKAHVSRLMRKVGVANRIALTMYAMQHLFPFGKSKKT